MPYWSRGVGQLCASLKPAIVSQGWGRAAVTAPAAALPHAAAAMPRLLCTASSVQGRYDLDSIEVSLVQQHSAAACWVRPQTSHMYGLHAPVANLVNT
jgi:hypothetical protein